MKLTMTGKHTLETLEKWAVDLFSAVPNKNVKVPYLGEPKLPYTEENLGQFVRF